MIAEVIVDISNSEVDKIFDYFVEGDSAKIGSRVYVPFGSRTIEGYIINFKEKSDFPAEKIKPITSVIDSYPIISQEQLQLMQFMVKKYHLRVIDAIRLFIPSQMRSGKVKELIRQVAYINPEFLNREPTEFIKPSAHAQMDVFLYLRESNEPILVSELNKIASASALRNLTMRDIVLLKDVEVRRTPYKNLENETKKVVLTDAQRSAVNQICFASNTTFLLHGVTGSGKTEVYMNCISQALQSGKTAIMLVPEISLTPQVLKNFRSKFGDSVAILHSGLSAGERFDEWKRLLGGEATVAVGARSAIFAPVKNLGIIIIDEEHDGSYVSESNPRYNTIDIAEFRKNYNGCNIVLGSATPSIDSYYYSKNDVYKLIELPERINKKPLPTIEVVNMCRELYEGNNSLFSRKLESELNECIDGNNQAIIFINRRGYSSYVMCRSCGYVAKCDQCDVSLVYHRDEKILKCHYCNNRYAPLDLCPNCKSQHIKQGFVGTEQVVEKLKLLFPTKTILRMDNDTTQTKDAHAEILQQFADKNADILVGTQMIAKGHDFPDVTLVGIIDADMSLHFSDYRSIERTYQLITQVSGRAGRDNKVGKVVLQTYSPNHYVYKFAVNNDYCSFYSKEINLREVTKYPPFSRIIRILLSSEYEEILSSSLKNIFNELTELQKNYIDNIIYMAAMRSPVKKIQSKFRMQIILRIRGDEDAIMQNIYSITDKYYNPKILYFIEQNPSSLS